MKHRKFAEWLRVVFVLCAAARLSTAAESEPSIIGPRAGYEAVVAQVERLIRHELVDKQLSAMSIALVDDQSIVWAAGFGEADPREHRPATAASVYRVGSVSKLFTDLAVMQLVERGELDLDAPVTDYLIDFQPRNPFDAPITLRQLMSHRAGLVREPPVGNYFDRGEPSLSATVESLNRTSLVYRPGTRTKYSNAGIAVVGYVLERKLGRPFSDVLTQAVLEPLGTTLAGFKPTPAMAGHLARGTMWTYDGRTFAAPEFGLGTAPAGNLYASVIDLSRFLLALFHDGQAAHGRLVRAETLRAMWTPQGAAAGEPRSFGLGFALGELEGRRRIGHGGAIYGFATELAALPEAKVGVVVVANKDVANAVVRHVADEALRLLLARQAGRPLAETARPESVDASRAAQLAGRYVEGQRAVTLNEQNGRLLIRLGDIQAALRTRGEGLFVDDVLSYGTSIARDGADGLVIDGQTYRRVAHVRPEPPPERWRGLIGEYGWDHNTFYILEEAGRLTALIEWFFYYPLEELGPDTFAFPSHGLYQDEKLVFRRAADGRATEVEAAGIVFTRRPAAAGEEATFRVQPLRPIDALRHEALSAQPPRESGEYRRPELVDVATLDPTIRFDIRYATANNFLGAPVYDRPRALLQRPAAEALVRVHRRLHDAGCGILIHDAYRPWYVTKMFWDAVGPEQKMFVADPALGSRHNRGCAVDLTLYELSSGQAVEMPSLYDEFSPRAFPAYPGGTSRQRWHRELLRRAMEAEGFKGFDFEWWHFDHADWRRYPILNQPFEQP